MTGTELVILIVSAMFVYGVYEFGYYHGYSEAQPPKPIKAYDVYKTGRGFIPKKVGTVNATSYEQAVQRCKNEWGINYTVQIDS